MENMATNAHLLQNQMSNSTHQYPQCPWIAVNLPESRICARKRVDGNDGWQLEDIYQNEKSIIIQIEVINLYSERVTVNLRVDLRKPFHNSDFGFQLQNENLNRLEQRPSNESSSHHLSVSPSTSTTLTGFSDTLPEEDFNELFNQVCRITSLELLPHEKQSLIFTFRPTIDTAATSTISHEQISLLNVDANDDYGLKPFETAFVELKARLVFTVSCPSLLKGNEVLETVIPLRALVCRSFLRIDSEDLHFDDCVPGGAYVKDFTVWNCSEISLVFRLSSSSAAFESTRDILECSDYDTGLRLSNKLCHVPAYGHMHIRVTFRPREVGENVFMIDVENVNDWRNVKSVKVSTIVNTELHREGLLICEESHLHLRSGSVLDFGDCYTGIKVSKVLHIKNTTQVPLHVRLFSERQKDITFELKFHSDMCRNSKRKPKSSEVDLLKQSTAQDLLAQDALDEDMDTDGGKTNSIYELTEGEENDLNKYTRVGSDYDPDENEGDYFRTFEDQTGQLMPPKEETYLDNDQIGEDVDDDFEFDYKDPPIRRLSKTNLNAKVKKDGQRRGRDEGTNHPEVDGGGELLSLSENSLPDSTMYKKPGSVAQSSTSLRNHAKEFSATSNYLIEALQLAPGVERTLLVWYCPPPPEAATELKAIPDGDSSSSDVDPKEGRLIKQSFRLIFKCSEMRGTWQQGKRIEFDDALGKSIQVKARVCTSLVSVFPSILNFGDCTVGEQKSMTFQVMNRSELPTTIETKVISKVVSCFPSDKINLQPKQSFEIKAEIIPRQVNPHYTRQIVICNLQNKLNTPEVTVRSSNMDAHHVIYHSLFYKLITGTSSSSSSYLNFDHVAVNSRSLRMIVLRNITKEILSLYLKSSDETRVKLYRVTSKTTLSSSASNSSTNLCELSVEPQQQHLNGEPDGQKVNGVPSSALDLSIKQKKERLLQSMNSERNPRSTSSVTSQSGSIATEDPKSKMDWDFMAKRTVVRRKRLRRRSFSGISNETMLDAPSTDGRKREKPSSMRSLGVGKKAEITSSVDRCFDDNVESLGDSLTADRSGRTVSLASISKLVSSFEQPIPTRSEPLSMNEENIVNLILTRSHEASLAMKDGRLERILEVNALRIDPEAEVAVVVEFCPLSDGSPNEVEKIRIEKHKVEITLCPPQIELQEQNASPAASSIVRDLLLKAKVGRSLMCVNQKNINFGKLITATMSSKAVTIRNLSALPLVYKVSKTGSISSGFLRITDGLMGVVRPFASREIRFVFQPSLPGPFEEKLEIQNIQDPDNIIDIKIKAKVVKPETFKLPQLGQTLSFGSCLVGERSGQITIAVRNTSRQTRTYVVQADVSAFSISSIQPSFFFAMENTPAASITQAEEQKLEEELEKLEHKLRIATTKQKTEKITKLRVKIKKAKAILNGESFVNDATSAITSPSTIGNSPYDSATSESDEESESLLQPKALRKFRLSMNGFSFSLNPESIGYICASVTFSSVTAHNYSSNSVNAGLNAGVAASPKRRQQPFTDVFHGTGLFVLYEKKNKDVMKEIPYTADVYLRSKIGEMAYCRSIGRPYLAAATDSLPQSSPSIPGGKRRGILSNGTNNEKSLVPRMDLSSSSPSKLQAPMDSSILHIKKEAEDKDRSWQIDSAISKSLDQVSISPTTSGSALSAFTVLLEESSTNSNENEKEYRSVEKIILNGASSSTVVQSWKFTVRSCIRKRLLIDFVWESNNMDSVIAFTYEVYPPDKAVVNDASRILSSPRDIRTSGENLALPGHGTFPLRLRLNPSDQVLVQVKWSLLHKHTHSVDMIDTSDGMHHVDCGNIVLSPVALMPLNNRVFYRFPVQMKKKTNNSITVFPLQIDLGQNTRDSLVESQFTVCNNSCFRVKFLLMVSSTNSNSTLTPSTGGNIIFTKSTGEVEPKSQAIVSFSYKATAPGKYQHQILIRNLSNHGDSATITVSIHVTRPVYVSLPSLDPLLTGQLATLDVGHIFVNPLSMQKDGTFAKVDKVTIQSQVQEPLLMTAQSNLKKQCYVYSDSELLNDANKIYLPGKASIDLYLAFQPHLAQDAYKTGACRELLGGVRVTLYEWLPEQSPNEPEMLAEFTIAFSGVAGASILKVSPKLLDLGVKHLVGWSKKVSQKGQFTLTNVTNMLPLRYRIYEEVITGSSSSTIPIESRDLTLHLSSYEGEISPEGSVVIQVEVSANGPGLLKRTLIIENLSSVGQQMSIVVQLFVDERSIKLQSLCSSFDGFFVEENEGKEETIRVEMGVIPIVSRGETETSNESGLERFRIFEEARFDHREFSVTNMNNVSMNLTPHSNMPIRVLLVDERQSNSHSSSCFAFGETMKEDKNDNLIPCGESFILAPRSCLKMCIRFPVFAMTSPLPIETVQKGKLFLFEGMFALRRTDTCKKYIIKTMSFVGSYCMSWLEVAEKEISLGKVGYVKAWQPTLFHIKIKNMSEGNTRLSLSVPAQVVLIGMHGAKRIKYEKLLSQHHENIDRDFPSLRNIALERQRGKKGQQESFLWSLNPLTECIAALEFRHEYQAEAGKCDFTIKVLNFDNPHNIQNIHVSAQVVAQFLEFNIQTAYTIDKEPTTVLLPPLVVPPNPSTPPSSYCNAIVSIKNVYDGELQLKFDVSTAAIVESILELGIVSRGSNRGVTNLLLAPNEQFDLRVTCTAFTSSRLPPDLLQYTHSDTSKLKISRDDEHSVALGGLQIDIGAADDGSPDSLLWFREQISLKGSFLPGTTLSLSPTSIDFNAIPIYASSEEVNERNDVSLHRKNDFYKLRRSSEILYISNPSTTQVLNFQIEGKAARQPGLRILLDTSPSDVEAEGTFTETKSDFSTLTDTIIPVTIPSKGTLAPNESMPIQVHLIPGACSSPNNSWKTDESLPNDVIGELDELSLLVYDVDAAVGVSAPTKVDIRFSLHGMDKLLTSQQLGMKTSIEDQPLTRSNGSSKHLFLDTEASTFSPLLVPHGSLPVLGLRGCTPVRRSSLENVRYVIDVGQQTLRLGAEVEWEITITNLNASVPSPLEFRLYTVDERASRWLQFSRDQGVLDFGQNSQNITLFFLRDNIGLFSTFLIIENTRNPSDIKLVRVSMEVVADVNALRGLCSVGDNVNLFHVLVSHKNKDRMRPSKATIDRVPSLEIHYGEIYYNQLYHNRSIVIVNSSSLPLDFMLSSNSSKGEIMFSLSVTSLKEITTVSLDAHTRLQVFIHFRPMPSIDREVLNGARSDESTVWEREIEVYVNCRLVKDFQETIIMRARCCYPQLQLQVKQDKVKSLLQPIEEEQLQSSWDTSYLGLIFAAQMIRSEEQSLDISSGKPEGTNSPMILFEDNSNKKYSLVVLENTRDFPAVVAVRNDTRYFSVEVIADGLEPNDDVGGKISSTSSSTSSSKGSNEGSNNVLLLDLNPKQVLYLEIKPKLKKLNANQHQWEKNVEEHITIYNRLQYPEHYHVSLRFTISNTANFFISPSHKDAYPYSKLEDTIARFLQSFNWVWKQLEQLENEESDFLLEDQETTTKTSPNSSYKQTWQSKTNMELKSISILSKLQLAESIARPCYAEKNSSTNGRSLLHSSSIKLSESSTSTLDSLAQAYSDIFFDFYYITDELVWYAAKGNVGWFAFTLANLVYGVIFSHEMFSPFFERENSESKSFSFLLPWVNQLGHFLSYFPEEMDVIEPLRNMYERLRSFHYISSSEVLVKGKDSPT